MCIIETEAGSAPITLCTASLRIQDLSGAGKATTFYFIHHHIIGTFLQKACFFIIKRKETIRKTELVVGWGSRSHSEHTSGSGTWRSLNNLRSHTHKAGRQAPSSSTHIPQLNLQAQVPEGRNYIKATQICGYSPQSLRAQRSSAQSHCSSSATDGGGVGGDISARHSAAPGGRPREGSPTLV